MAPRPVGSPLDVFFDIAGDIQIHFREIDVDIDFRGCANILFQGIDIHRHRGGGLCGRLLGQEVAGELVQLRAGGEAEVAPGRAADGPGIEHVKSGKVREVFDLGDCFLFVASDRISAFDVIMPNGIPRKGEALTRLSHFWFDRTESAVSNHRLAGAGDPLPERLKPFEEPLSGRCMIVKKCEPLTIECVVRGYVVGSGWKDYQKTGAICGVRLPENLENCSELEQPIFTPATKAEEGHDENISFEVACGLVGKDIAEKARDLSLQIYSEGRAYARERGIIIADTKFEFGLDENGTLHIIDEMLTPDSSRFWPVDHYQPGISPPSFDKQFVRDWLEGTDWDKSSPPPPLPEEIVAETRRKYLEAYRRLTGQELPV